MNRFVGRTCQIPTNVLLFSLRLCGLEWVNKHFPVKTLPTSRILYVLIILLNQQHRNLTCLRELCRTPFYDEVK